MHFPGKTINCLFQEIASRLGSPAGSTDCGFIFYPHTDECQVDKILLQSKSGGINIKLIIKFDPSSSCCKNLPGAIELVKVTLKY